LSDLPAISAIEDDSFPAPYDPSLLKRLLQDFPESFFVATDESGELVGYCVCTLGGKTAHLISIAVCRNLRRRGIALVLLQRAIEYLAAQAVDELWLEVSLRNLEAVTLYAKLGFEEIGILEKYYSDGSDAVRMRLVLGEPTRRPKKENASGRT
jgi:ribosomal-protein-alanine N-acetyltransferase